MTLNTIGEAFQFIIKETLGKTVSSAIEQIIREHRK